jgi:hypothetical protein
MTDLDLEQNNRHTYYWSNAVTSCLVEVRYRQEFKFTNN